MTPRLLLFSFMIISFELHHSVSPAVAGDLTSWCKLTPYPQQCHAYLSRSRSLLPPINSLPDFFTFSVQTALTTAEEVSKTALSLGHECQGPREKAALADCLEVFDLAMEHLKKAIDRVTRSTEEDVQTWLSAALTYFQTCKDGFADLSVTASHILAMIDNADLSCLISNALAINKIGSSGDQKRTYRDWFPSWLRPGDRKLLQSSMKADLVVAKDGSGDYTTVSAAVQSAANRSGSERFVIHVKAGTYKENVQIGSKMMNIMLLGDGMGKTIISGRKSVRGGTTTFQSATVAAVGDSFMARGITFRNTAGPGNYQAVALRSGSDLSLFYQCSFEGYQDTLYVYSNRQFYRECDIYGTVDFIFGDAAVVFQNCNIYPRYPPAGANTITAQGRADPNQNTGISIQNCNVTAASDLVGKSGVKTYLGRPWKEYSRTVFLTTFLDSLIMPAGWLPWDGDFALDTLYYGEYMNTGPGSSTANRVKWKGYHVIKSAADASKFTVENLIAGGSWLPATNVPFDSGV
ncbi:hypothetical protein Nepgr_024234 [Nepenthes gracilis]|uniref:Pectinesterase n=1 Tax=Nepenthes gracilis TaxID=150966 RepID=A0AAD3T4A8_NEPGR|nr:hypothetical protein Nepgr_024234 [Nepenthes gracilis]